MDTVRVFAPASTGNIGPGFDVLGMALCGMGDTVTATRRAGPGVVIHAITGDGGALPKDAATNTAGIAAQAVLDHLGCAEGVALTLHKDVPGTGLGSSAASAVAAAFAVHTLFGEKLTRSALVPLAAIAESRVSGGYFLDNIGPAMMGGVTWNHPDTREVVQLGSLDRAVIIVAIPDFPVWTKDARRVLPQSIPMRDFISNMAQAAIMAWAVARQDVVRFGRAVHDVIIEPARTPLIRGFAAVKAAALDAGALGCSISGAGASVFAVTDTEDAGAKIGAAMRAAFEQNSVASQIRVTAIDPLGARVVANDTLHDAPETPRRRAEQGNVAASMRLRTEQVAVITGAARRHFGLDVAVWLFGSRADGARRGGDIDLYVETAISDPAQALRAELDFRTALALSLGEQRIDVVVHRVRTPLPVIAHVALRTGISLCAPEPQI